MNLIFLTVKCCIGELLCFCLNDYIVKISLYFLVQGYNIFLTFWFLYEVNAGINVPNFTVLITW